MLCWGVCLVKYSEDDAEATYHFITHCTPEVDAKWHVTGRGEHDGVGGGVTRCLGVRPDPGFRFGVRVPESGVGLDGASASGSLSRLDFHVRYLAIGGGCVMGHDGRTVDSDEGDRHE